MEEEPRNEDTSSALEGKEAYVGVNVVEAAESCRVSDVVEGEEVEVLRPVIVSQIDIVGGYGG